MRSGWCWSQPPCMRKPQGEPPVRLTSLAVIPALLPLLLLPLLLSPSGPLPLPPSRLPRLLPAYDPASRVGRVSGARTTTGRAAEGNSYCWPRATFWHTRVYCTRSPGEKERTRRRTTTLRWLPHWLAARATLGARDSPTRLMLRLGGGAPAQYRLTPHRAQVRSRDQLIDYGARPRKRERESFFQWDCCCRCRAFGCSAGSETRAQMKGSMTAGYGLGVRGGGDMPRARESFDTSEAREVLSMSAEWLFCVFYGCRSREEGECVRPKLFPIRWTLFGFRFFFLASKYLPCMHM